jgi:membrane protein YqaA with SNARE-associated domain
MKNKEIEIKSSKIHFFNFSIFDGNGNLDWKKLIGRMIALMALFLVIYAIGLFFVKDHYQNLAFWVAKTLGLGGIALFVFINDLFIIPMTVDILFPFVMNHNRVELLLVMGLSSALGGIGGYLIGRVIGHLSIIEAQIARFSKEGRLLIEKYGAWAVVIAALSPIPFTTVCYLAGMVKISPLKIIFATLARIPRMILYYFVIKGGLFLFF